MARTVAENRRYNRDRRAKQRAAARAAGVPPTERATSSVTEAFAFAMLSGVNIGTDESPRVMVDVAEVIKAAVDILSKRAGYDRARSKEAINKLLQPRSEHSWPGFIPSHAKPSTPAVEAA